MGNGISMLIFAGIVAGFPAAIGQSFEAARQGDINIIALLVIAALAVAIIAFVVYVERGQRRIVVNYAKRQQGRRVYQAQSSHLPLKVNMAGVIPAIFASSLLFGSGDHSPMVRADARHGMASRNCLGALSGEFFVRSAVRWRDYFFLLLLHGVDV